MTISFLLIIAYAVVIIRYCAAWMKTPVYDWGGQAPEGGISVIIPCRNEKVHLLNCLSALALQDLNLKQFEVIVVDDHSDDGTSSVAREFFQANPELNGRVINIREAGLQGKKAAITAGVQASEFPLIVTTDADCIAPNAWLSHILSFHKETGAKMIAAPMMLRPAASLLKELQSLEFLGLQVVTGGGIRLNEPVLCNGANLCFEKAAFTEVGGYTDNLEILSGDDLFLMQKISARHPGKVRYLKSQEAVVQTDAAGSIRQLLQQRRRWVSKVVYIPDRVTLLIALIVYLTNLSLLAGLLITVFTPDFKGSFLIFTFGAKALIDFLFLHLASSSFDRGKLMRYFIIGELVNIVYVSAIGVFGNIGKYRWKGRVSDHTSLVSNNS